jgi:rod shape-determining protein MreD
MRRSDRYRWPLLLAALVVLHFTVRGRLGPERAAPDFLLLALLIYAIRAQPGAGAAAGFGVGLLRDALVPASFGAGALAHTLVGYLTGWGKAVFFADNLAVNAGFFFGGTWIRNATVALASGGLRGERLAWELLVWGPVQGATTAVVGVVVLWLVRGWVTVRVRGA